MWVAFLRKGRSYPEPWSDTSCFRPLINQCKLINILGYILLVFHYGIVLHWFVRSPLFHVGQPYTNTAMQWIPQKYYKFINHVLLIDHWPIQVGTTNKFILTLLFKILILSLCCLVMPYLDKLTRPAPSIALYYVDLWSLEFTQHPALSWWWRMARRFALAGLLLRGAQADIGRVMGDGLACGL